jgi:ribonuclease P protein component
VKAEADRAEASQSPAAGPAPHPEAFLRAHRLLRKSDFDAVFKGGRKLVGQGFLCYVLLCEAGDPKLGLAVSRKVGNAVVRNRIKRRVRQFFRTHRGAFVSVGHIVVVARPEAAALNAGASDEALLTLFRRGGLLDG